MKARVPTRAAALAAVLLTACVRFTGGGIGPDAAGTETPGPGPLASPTSPPIQGGIQDGGGHAHVHPTPKPTPAATAQPTQPPSTAYAVEVTVSPKEVTLNTHARVSATPLYPTAATLSAEVLLSSGLKDTRVSWHSSRPETATVDENGLVTAGSATGDALIVATSLDGLATAGAKVTLTDFGAAEVVVD